ncbi:hypothetical protein LOC54_07135 [Acetobacter sp. AN02]|uniref:hypothetical protein n=1 Tax=Acetobacter sp. AN02 TaxID=2894186 RepID=UPI002434279B|nr:hypothetical protein [Acetobacter sp. AN02]MDG6094885.1 hypothetical protein [Acetobacter sp. AN02]
MLAQQITRRNGTSVHPGREPVKFSCDRRHGRLTLRRLTGYDAGTGRYPERMSEQLRLAVTHGVHSLSEAGVALEDVVKVIYRVRDAQRLPSCLSGLGDPFADATPASVFQIVDSFERPDVEIEVELVARIREQHI